MLAGNDAAFAQLLERYKNYVFAIIFPILRNKDDAEDAAQETFIKLYCSLYQYSQGSFKSWLGRISVNTAIDLKRKRERELPRENLLEGLPEDSLPQGPSVENELLGIEEENLENLCRGLPERYRSVVYQYYVLEKSCREIAVAQGVAVRTIESRLYRSRKMIRERMEEGRRSGKQNGAL